MSKHLDTNMGVNTGLDLLFVAKFQWGIAGAAIATILVQFLSAVLVLGVLTFTSLLADLLRPEK